MPKGVLRCHRRSSNHTSPMPRKHHEQIESAREKGFFRYTYLLTVTTGFYSSRPLLPGLHSFNTMHRWQRLHLRQGSQRILHMELAQKLGTLHRMYGRFFIHLRPDLHLLSVTVAAVLGIAITNTALIWLIGTPFDLTQERKFNRSTVP